MCPESLFLSNPERYGETYDNVPKAKRQLGTVDSIPKAQKRDFCMLNLSLWFPGLFSASFLIFNRVIGSGLAPSCLLVIALYNLCLESMPHRARFFASQVVSVSL